MLAANDGKLRSLYHPDKRRSVACKPSVPYMNLCSLLGLNIGRANASEFFADILCKLAFRPNSGGIARNAHTEDSLAIRIATLLYQGLDAS